MPWVRHRYRGNKVWIDVDDGGKPVLDDRGLACLRYKPEDERTYSVKPGEVHPLEDETENGETIRAYTDGASSGNPGPGGWGVVLQWRDKRRELSGGLGRTTNNVAELMAVDRALAAIRRPNLPVRIHTDSTYVIGVLDGGHRVKANEALIARIRERMAAFADLAFVKVRAHAGDPGNERADALARAAIDRFGEGTPPPKL